MEALLALGIGVAAGCGTWLLLRARTFEVALGLVLLGHAVNLFIFASGRLRPGAPPLAAPGVPASVGTITDPLPQALVLTAIVIGLAMTAVLLALALRTRAETGTDHVDGEEPAP